MFVLRLLSVRQRLGQLAGAEAPCVTLGQELTIVISVLTKTSLLVRYQAIDCVLQSVGLISRFYGSGFALWQFYMQLISLANVAKISVLSLVTSYFTFLPTSN